MSCHVVRQFHVRQFQRARIHSEGLKRSFKSTENEIILDRRRQTVPDTDNTLAKEPTPTLLHNVPATI